MPKKILVTGGAGFIGSHLVKALIQQGDQVTVIDNLSTGKRSNIHPKSNFIEADIRNLESIKPHFQGIEGVFHVAALPRVQVSIANPTETNEINITGTLNVIMAARDAKVRRLVYSASSSAYGEADVLPLREDLKPNPKSPYGLQKYVGEEYAKLAALFWGLETVSLRYFNVYGPGMASEGAYVTVIAIFNRQRLNGEALTITGDGTQTRDFTYVEDVVRANLLAMASDQVGQGEVINIGNGDNHSVNQVAEMVGGEVKHIPPRVEPHDTLADNAQARALLNWQPQTGFADGLNKTIEWYNQHADEFIIRK